MMNISICPQRRKRIMNHENYYYSECNFNELGLTTAMSVTQSIIVAKLQDAAWRGRDSLGQAQNSLLSVYERLQQTFLQHRDTQSF